jgi:predicted acylesterase/phospholipase RssA
MNLVHSGWRGPPAEDKNSRAALKDFVRDSKMEEFSATVAMVFAGGLGLAAYHAGPYQAFSNRRRPLHWAAGSSAGAVTAALIAGNRGR